MSAEPKFEKLERDGKIAVLYSPGFGAGWYSWNSEHEGLLFDREIVERVLAGDRKAAVAIAREKYPEMSPGGGDQLEVEWISKGERFFIHEYDGNENVEIIDPNYGHVA